ncbi:MAG: hypothetical protein NTW29_22565 [Bacteroidetes bacterium]|nr:hypothetical protein [Bacteroidota bacterium]
MKTLLFFLLVFVAGTSIVSGMMMIIAPDGHLLQLSPALLEYTPFNDYFLPGIILSAVVGGVSLLGIIANLLCHTTRYNWAMAGGVLLVIWIVVQMLLIDTFHPLQLLFLFVGAMIILIAWQLKGKWAV